MNTTYNSPVACESLRKAANTDNRTYCRIYSSLLPLACLNDEVLHDYLRFGLAAHEI